MSRKSNIKISYITRIGILSALGAVLMYVPPIKIPIMPPFLSLDFSDFPAILASFALGPVGGIAVCLFKNLLHLFGTTTLGVGELSNFLLGVFFVLPTGIIYKKRRTFGGAVIACVAGICSMSAGCFIVNCFVTYPLYYLFVIPKDVILGMYSAILPSVKSIPRALLIFNVPFTFCKALINSIVVFVIYKRVSPLLKVKR